MNIYNLLTYGIMTSRSIGAPPLLSAISSYKSSDVENRLDKLSAYERGSNPSIEGSRHQFDTSLHTSGTSFTILDIEVPHPPPRILTLNSTASSGHIVTHIPTFIPTSGSIYERTQGVIDFTTRINYGKEISKS
jgi:NADH:ubiquinone oxidoreductase subunit 3 (subunit A)